MEVSSSLLGSILYFFGPVINVHRIPFTFSNLAEKALRIEVVVDPARAIQDAQAQAAQAALASGSPAAAAGRRTASRGRGRGGRGGRGGGAGRTKQPKKTAEELDAEMEDWSGQNKKEAPAA